MVMGPLPNPVSCDLGHWVKGKLIDIGAGGGSMAQESKLMPR